VKHRSTVGNEMVCFHYCYSMETALWYRYKNCIEPIVVVIVMDEGYHKTAVRRFTLGAVVRG